MLIERAAIDSILLLVPIKRCDARGFFSEVYRRDILAAEGVQAEFVQDNHVFSTERGTLRGLHFQTPPKAQGKLVRCTHGAILDVAVDIRKGSICRKSQKRGQNRSRRPELSRRPGRRDSLHSVSRNLGKPSDLMTREKRGSGPRPSGYPHSRTENTHKIANGKAAINRGHPAVLTGCVHCSGVSVGTNRVFGSGLANRPFHRPPYRDRRLSPRLYDRPWSARALDKDSTRATGLPSCSLRYYYTG
jgi:hypothetical protein